MLFKKLNPFIELVVQKTYDRSLWQKATSDRGRLIELYQIKIMVYCSIEPSVNLSNTLTGVVIFCIALTKY